MHVEFVDLKRQNHIHQAEFLKVVKKVMLEATFSLGKPLEAFETQFAKFVGAKYCVGVDSGTDALELALRALGIGPKDEVITAPNSYVSTAMVISNVGATPVFVDINPATYTIDPLKVAASITKKTKALIPVHLCGQPADMDPLITLARRYKLHIVEDCCQAHGAKYNGKAVPVTGTGAFSFYPGKNLGGFGDGGALVINDATTNRKIQLLRNDGSIKKYHHEIIGHKSRLDALQAAILSAKLKYLPKWNVLRRRHAAKYTKLLRQIPEVVTPTIAPYATHNFHLYVIEVPRRDQLQQYLAKMGIATVIHYPTPIHLQPAYKHLGYKRGDFPVTEAAAKRILSLPMFPELTNQEINFVATKIREFYSQ